MADPSIERLTWRHSAACRGADIALFYNEGPCTEAKAYCARCPVTAECLDDALTIRPRDDYGIRAGMGSNERRAIRRARKAAAA